MTLEPDEIIAQALVRIRRDQQARHLQRRAANGDTTVASAADAARFRYLDALDEAPDGLPISRIADAIGVDRPRASRLTTELLTDGRIERAPHAGDSRYAPVRLTPYGRDLVAGVREVRRHAVGQALAGFTADEARILAILLERFVDAWPRSDRPEAEDLRPSRRGTAAGNTRPRKEREPRRDGEGDTETKRATR
ncbi:MarR family transcriptional regulator [Actinoplanes hulinensis]|uniref:MarR family transcriptional regulator n=1 Tax=Actinoplanes hulinensis TaxID=1144547 RepID=A0ABS7B1V9_9ACTN|nr:MarR family transcriptional regulator [Actinoplanes hulinensis]MBW6435029.1 MarR family transcriptional regulator [Actinoplanes hulinensis]